MSFLYLSRQGSGASEQPPRSDSRLSDYSGALPDLESQLFDEEDGPLLFSHKYVIYMYFTPRMRWDHKPATKGQLYRPVC